MRIRSIGFVFVISLAILLLADAPGARAALKTESVTYQQGHVTAHGFLAYDDSLSAKRPGVLVVPEWWGLNDYARRRAKMLAGLGYVALAVDIYGDGQNTTDYKQASAWSSKLEAGDRKELRARIADALQELKRDRRVDPDRTAAIGYCFGGLTVLELARSGADVNGVVAFHGPLNTHTPAQPGEVKAKILACEGGDDPYVPPAAVQAFEDEMRKAGANWEINLYSGARHSFTNPDADQLHSPDLAYNPQADHRSWQAMRDFFKEIFTR